MENNCLVARSIIARRGRTSMRLEPALWHLLREICKREGQDLSDMIRHIEDTGEPGSRTSAVRVYIARYYHAASTEAGHFNAGHGAEAGGIVDLSLAAA